MGQGGFRNIVELLLAGRKLSEKIQQKKAKIMSVFGGETLGEGHAQRNVEQAGL